LNGADFDLELSRYHTQLIAPEVRHSKPSRRIEPAPPDGTDPFVFTNIAFLRKPGNTIAPYTFYALVDAENQIAESSEADNNLTVTKLLRPPRFSHIWPSPDLNRVSADGKPLQLSFSNVSVKLAGTDAWVDAK